MRIPNNLLKAVGFIAKESAPEKYIGTGFLVNLPWTRSKNVDGTPRTQIYIVTAKHVKVALCGEDYVFSTNGRDGSRLDVKLPGHIWLEHPTEGDSVDVAVSFFIPKEPISFPMGYVTADLFVTPDNLSELQIGLGDEIFTAGLFHVFPGCTQRTPIVRTGNLAMMPTDKVLLPNFGYAEVYLAESRSIGGLSGSPVFVRRTVAVTTKKGDANALTAIFYGEHYFLGLMQGHWDVHPGDAGERSSINMGVAIIVPAHKILETLRQPDLEFLKSMLDDPDAWEWF